MRLNLRAHFDGKFIVPEEQVDLPINEPLNVEVSTIGTGKQKNPGDALRAFLQRTALRPVARLTDQKTRRESIYEDR